MPKDSEYRVLRVKNISNFDFTGELGARYGGRDFVIPAGKSLLAPYHLAHHLAKHLARQILLKKAPKRDAKQMDGKGNDRPLWDDQAITDLKAKILVEEFSEAKAPVLSESDRLADRVNRLNQSEREHQKETGGGNAPLSPGEIDTTGSTTGEITYRDKAEVIAALDKKGVKYNARDSRASLEALLK